MVEEKEEGKQEEEELVILVIKSIHYILVCFLKTIMKDEVSHPGDEYHSVEDDEEGGVGNPGDEYEDTCCSLMFKMTILTL